MDPGAMMDCVVVCGNSGVEEALVEAMQRRFSINAEVFNAACCLQGDAERGAAASGFAAALGLVLAQLPGEPVQFDFLHPKKVEKPGAEQMRRIPRVAAVAALFVVAAIVAYLRGPAQQYAALHRIENEIDDVNAEIRENRDFIRMVDAAAAFEKEQVVWVDELRRLVEALPSDSREVVLERLDLYQKEKRISLPLRVKDSITANKIVAALESFRPEDWKKPGPYYRVKRGAGNQVSGPYSHEEQLTIAVAPAEAAGKGARK
jgi:hypothetical protein